MIDGARQFAHASLHTRQQARTLWCKSYRAAVADEQRSFEKLFERFDVRADRRGRDVEGLGGSGEAQMSSNGFEGAQRIERQFGGIAHRTTASFKIL